MAKLVLDLAQTVQDDFYQQYRDAAGFFTIEDFARALIDECDARIEAEFYAQLKSSKGGKFVAPAVNPSWVIHEFVPIEKEKETEKWIANICKPFYQFPEDEWGYGVQDVAPFGQSCGDFIRIKQSQVWSLCLVDLDSQVLFTVDGCRLILYNFHGCTDKLDVTIVPSQSGLPMSEQTIPDGQAAPIREAVLSKMLRNYQAKLGKIPMINSGNANPQQNETAQ